jgi:hypothetical protein
VMAPPSIQSSKVDVLLKPVPSALPFYIMSESQSNNTSTATTALSEAKLHAHMTTLAWAQATSKVDAA